MSVPAATVGERALGLARLDVPDDDVAGGVGRGERHPVGGVPRGGRAGPPHAGHRAAPVGAAVQHLERVQTVPFRISVCGLLICNFKIQIGAQMMRTIIPPGTQRKSLCANIFSVTIIPHLKPILSTSKLKIEMQIEMKWYFF